MTNSERRRAQNEVVFKQRNEAIMEAVRDILADGEQADLPISFICECSDEDCRETIELTVAQYENARKTSRDFIIKPGHEHTDIEKVIKQDQHLVVEKFEEPPASDGVLNRT